MPLLQQDFQDPNAEAGIILFQMQKVQAKSGSPTKPMLHYLRLFKQAMHPLFEDGRKTVESKDILVCTSKSECAKKGKT